MYRVPMRCDMTGVVGKSPKSTPALAGVQEDV